MSSLYQNKTQNKKPFPKRKEFFIKIKIIFYCDKPVSEAVTVPAVNPAAACSKTKVSV